MRTSFVFNLLLVLFLFAATGCDPFNGEGGKTVVEGQAVDRHTGQAVPNARVGVYLNNSSSTWGGYTIDFEKQADEKGNFSFSFEGNNSKDYLLRAFTDKGAYTLWQEAEAITPGKNNKRIKLKVQTPAWLKIKLKNQLPKDTIWVDIWPLTSGDLTLNMLMRDTTIIGLVAGNETRQINWEYTNSRGIKIRESKQLFFPGSDTVSLEINY